MSNSYESDELLQQYLVFHYAPEQQFPYEFGGPMHLVFHSVALTMVLTGRSFQREVGHWI